MSALRGWAHIQKYFIRLVVCQGADVWELSLGYQVQHELVELVEHDQAVCHHRHGMGTHHEVWCSWACSPLSPSNWSKTTFSSSTFGRVDRRLNEAEGRSGGGPSLI